MNELRATIARPFCPAASGPRTYSISAAIAASSLAAFARPSSVAAATGGAGGRPAAGVIAVDRDGAVDPCTVEGAGAALAAAGAAGVVGGGSIAAGGVAGAAAGACACDGTGMPSCCIRPLMYATTATSTMMTARAASIRPFDSLLVAAGTVADETVCDAAAGVVPLGSCAAAIPEDEAGT